MWLSFPEPHNPYQVSEPYYSMFPPEKLPPVRTGLKDLAVKGPEYELLHEMMSLGHAGYYEHLDRLRSNYLGMIRLIDDQIARLVEQLRKDGTYENTVFVVTADHGDFAGEYRADEEGRGALGHRRARAVRLVRRSGSGTGFKFRARLAGGRFPDLLRDGPGARFPKACRDAV